MLKKFIQSINRTLRNMLIAKKIQLIIFTLIFFFFILMVVVLLNFIDTTQDEIAKRMETSEKSVEKALQFYKKYLITSATLIAENPEIKKNLLLSSSEIYARKLVNTLNFLQEKSPVQYSWVYNQLGHIVASGHDPFNTVVLYDMDNTLFQHGIQGKSVYTIDSPSPNKMILKIAVPIYKFYNKNDIIGVCILGINIDAAFATTIRDISGVEIFFLDDERLIATSFGTPETADKEIFIEKNSGRKKINGIVYDIYYTGIWSSEYIRNFSVALAIDNSQIRNDLRESLRQVLIIFISAIFLTYLFSNKITNIIVLSLNNVIKGAKKISQKDFSYKIDTQTEDELGLLGETFNYMSEEIADYALFLKQSEERFRQVTELSPFPILIISKEGSIEYLNPEFSKILGYEKQDIQTIQEFARQGFYDPLEREAFFAFWNQNISEQESTPKTFKIQSKNLIPHIATFRLVRIDNQKQFIILEDITERIKAEEALQESRERYKLLFESMFNGFSLHEMIYDEEHNPVNYRYIEVNPAFEDLTGYKKENLIGKTILDIMPKVSKKWIKKYAEIAETGKSIQFEFYAKKADRYYDVFAFSHKKGMFATLFNDITQRKKSEEEIKRFNEELEMRVKERTAKLMESLDIIRNAQDQLVQAEKLAALGSLVAGIAHEINTPVGIGVTAASYLEQKTKDASIKIQSGNFSSQEIIKYIETAVKSSSMIMNNLNRAAELIQNFKQVAVDQTSEQKRIFKFREYLDSILLSLHPQLKKTKHEIKINCDPDLSINSYPGVFSQIFTNLIINSLVHGFEKKENGQIAIDIEKKNNIINMRYSDNGSGIAEDIMPKIFDPFFTTKRGQGGSGLGLHIVYNLITAKLGGKIECSSKVGEHTTFVIQIPENWEKKNVSE